jgi:HD-GYP domain-containing protein (c-di-GMP phosphodiesterase class II)
MTAGPQTPSGRLSDGGPDLAHGTRDATPAARARLGLAKAVDAKDPSTRRHSDRVADMAAGIGRILGWAEDRCRLLHDAAAVHDVGKIAIPDQILFKPEGLTELEYEMVKDHSRIGAEMLDGVLTDEQVAWVLHHHERWSGGGYPDGLVGEAIPVGARIIAVADAWDAIISWRPYGRPRSPAEALIECRSHSGTQFWPEAVAGLESVVGP